MTWKKRCVSLIVCFALIVSITVVRPPKAEAIAFEAGIAVPIILAVAIASGITFLSDGMTESGLTEYIGQQLQQFVTDIGTTVSDWWDGLGTLGRNDSGQVILSPPFYRGVQQFLTWWKGENDITAGVQDFSVLNHSRVTIGGVSYPFVRNFYNFGSNNSRITITDPSYLDNSFLISPDLTLDNAVVWNYFGDYQLYLFHQGTGYRLQAFKNGVYSFQYFNSSYNNRVFFTNRQGYLVPAWCSSNNSDSYVVSELQSRDGTYIAPTLESVGLSENSLSVSQPASYDALELQDNESVALDLGATVEAGATLEDILAEYLAKIVDNTATAAQEVTTESGEGEGEGDDDDTAPYLPFIPRIWEKLQGLPDDIADKVHDLFVPSAAFVEALPAEFADVFDSRCGLLTYPAALLADFLTRLATLTAQEPVLRWGNIKEPFSDRQLIAAGSYNLNSAIQTDAMQTVYNVYMICVKAAVAFWFVELCKRKYEKIIRS